MEGEDPSRIVDLGRYREAAKAESAKAVKARAPERMLGSRPRAGLILVLIIATAIAWWLIPRLF